MTKRIRLTQKQETFCLKYFELRNATEAALVAGYSPKTAPFIASENLKKPQIEARLTALRQKAEDATISTVQERRKILTEIQRARFGDFCDEHGNLKANPNLNSAAIREIKTERTIMGIRTTLKLHDPVPAITEHNKMDKVYSEMPPYQDNRTYNILVADDETKQEIKRLIKGRKDER